MVPEISGPGPGPQPACGGNIPLKTGNIQNFKAGKFNIDKQIAALDFNQSKTRFLHCKID
jgi:hypothetical protein